LNLVKLVVVRTSVRLVQRSVPYQPSRVDIDVVVRLRAVLVERNMDLFLGVGDLSSTDGDIDFRFGSNGFGGGFRSVLQNREGLVTATFLI
jgi:hypothetical protein